MGFGLAGAIAATSKTAKKFKSGQSDTSKPFHTHSSSKDTSGGTNVGMERYTLDNDPRPNPSFMGKGQMDDFASLTDPSSVDREGNVIAPAPTALPLTGQTPSDIPSEDAFKITPRQDIDEIGMNKLYNK
jgi:hypothetical protein